MFIALVVVSAVFITGLTLLLWRIGRTPTIPDRVIRERAKWSLRLHADQPLIISCDVMLPGEVWNARKRLLLIITADDGREWRNTFDALNRREGMNISPAVDRTPPAPHLSPEFISTLETDGHAETTRTANVALLGLPGGTHRYRVRAQLDELQSNELLISIMGR